MATDLGLIDDFEHEFSQADGMAKRDAEPDWSKFDMAEDAGFGAPVLVVFSWGAREDGYLTTLPGRTAPTLHGLVHMPDMDRVQDGWTTVFNLMCDPDVVRVAVGAEPIEKATAYADHLESAADAEDGEAE